MCGGEEDEYCTLSCNSLHPFHLLISLCVYFVLWYFVDWISQRLNKSLQTHFYRNLCTVHFWFEQSSV